VAELAVDLGVDVAGLDWVSPVVIVVLKETKHLNLWQQTNSNSTH
jgi:hypothetical protein